MAGAVAQPRSLANGSLVGAILEIGDWATALNWLDCSLVGGGDLVGVDLGVELGSRLRCALGDGWSWSLSLRLNCVDWGCGLLWAMATGGVELARLAALLDCLDDSLVGSVLETSN